MRSALALLAALTTLVPAVAVAQGAGHVSALDQGKAQYVQAEFEAAEQAFTAALEHAPDAATAAQAQSYLVALALIFDHPDQARAHARAAVALAPAVPDPPGAPPAAAALLAQARRERAGAPLRLHLGPDGPSRLAATLAPTIDGVVARLELRCNDARGQRHATGGPPPSIVLRVQDVPRPFHCSAVGRLASGAPFLEARYVAARPRSHLPWGWIIGGSAVVAAAAIVVVVLVASQGGDALVNGVVLDR